MLAKSNDGHGAQVFYDTLAQEPSIERMLARFRATPAEETIPDQWQAQIFGRVLQRAHVLYLSDAPDEMVQALHMQPVHSLEEGLETARKLLGKPDATVTVIPDGVSVMVTEEESR